MDRKNQPSLTAVETLPSDSVWAEDKAKNAQVVVDRANAAQAGRIRYTVPEWLAVSVRGKKQIYWVLAETIRETFVYGLAADGSSYSGYHAA